MKSSICEGYMLGEVVSIPRFSKSPSSPEKDRLTVRLRGKNPWGAMVWADIVFVGEMASAWKSVTAIGDTLYVRWFEHSIASGDSRRRAIRNLKIATEAVQIAKGARARGMVYDSSSLITELDPMDALGIKEYGK